MNSERKIRIGKARSAARWVATAAFAIVASLVAGAPNASAQASGWQGSSSELGTSGLLWNGYGYVAGYQWPPTPECNCEDTCTELGFDPNDPNQVCPCEPAMCDINYYDIQNIDLNVFLIARGRILDLTERVAVYDFGKHSFLLNSKIIDAHIMWGLMKVGTSSGDEFDDIASSIIKSCIEFRKFMKNTATIR